MFIGKSPCNGVCVPLEGTEYCLGCIRTLSEIADWKSMERGQQAAIWKELGERRSRLKGDTRIKDQLKREIPWPSQITSIVSLVPSITQTLIDLGLEEKIIGTTEYCPKLAHAHADLTLIGGTKNPDLKAITELQPSLILANKEENKASSIEKLEKICPVWVSDIVTLKDSLHFIERLGDYLNAFQRANEIIQNIQSELPEIEGRLGSKTCVYLIWKSPYMVAAKETFIHSWLHHLGLTNIFADLERYPKIKVEDLIQRQPDYVFLPDEPYKFTEACRSEFQTWLPKSKVILVKGVPFTWFGSSMLEATQYFKSL